MGNVINDKISKLTTTLSKVTPTQCGYVYFYYFNYNLKVLEGSGNFKIIVGILRFKSRNCEINAKILKIKSEFPEKSAEHWL